jgi:hypothetical protein
MVEALEPSRVPEPLTAVLAAAARSRRSEGDDDRPSLRPMVPMVPMVPMGGADLSRRESGGRVEVCHAHSEQSRDPSMRRATDLTGWCHDERAV